MASDPKGRDAYMFKYVRSALDEQALQTMGLESAWQDKANRDDIVKYVYGNMDSREMLEWLERNMGEDQFSDVMNVLFGAFSGR